MKKSKDPALHVHEKIALPIQQKILFDTIKDDLRKVKCCDLDTLLFRLKKRKKPPFECVKGNGLNFKSSTLILLKF